MFDTTKKNIWEEELSRLADKYNITDFWYDMESCWQQQCSKLLTAINDGNVAEIRQAALSSRKRIYRNLDFSKGNEYLGNVPQKFISWIFKARCDMLGLNSNDFQESNNKECSLCNLREAEDMVHFLGKCPVLREFRSRYIGKAVLNESECIYIY